MKQPTVIPFQIVLEALLDEGKPFHARYLYRLSDLAPEEAAQLHHTWPKLSLRRRQAVLEDIEEFGTGDYLLDFNEVGRLALFEEDATLRLLAVRTLVEYEDDELVHVFMNMAENDADAQVRAASATALGPFVYLGEVEDLSPEVLRDVEDCLLRVTNSKDEKLVRRRALESLGFSSREEVPALLEAAYSSGDRDWLITSLFAMGRSYNSQWEENILASLSDRRAAVRAEAASAAGELELKKAGPELLYLLEDRDEDVRAAATWSLSQIGGEDVREALEDLLEFTEDEDEVDLIESALENLDFTEEFQNFALLDVPDEEDQDFLPDNGDLSGDEDKED